VLSLLRRRPPSLKRRLADARQLDVPWARCWAAGVVRETFLRFVLRPTMGFYTRRRTTGRDKLARIRGPVILVANHASHMDTPAILAALPRRLRRRTTVAAAADYFYRNRLVASMVSLIFNTVPLERCGGGLSKRATDHLDRLLDEGWSLLLYPEGTRSRSGGMGRLRLGAAVLALAHGLSIVPVRVTGTRNAMPPGRAWPKRLRGRLLSKRHNVEICFGDPIAPAEDPAATIDRVRRFLEAQDAGATKPRTPAPR
jgi:1-acyl-sn-glycerol-3-phosphate acyltransferase